MCVCWEVCSFLRWKIDHIVFLHTINSEVILRKDVYIEIKLEKYDKRRQIQIFQKIRKHISTDLHSIPGVGRYTIEIRKLCIQNYRYKEDEDSCNNSSTEFN